MNAYNTLFNKILKNVDPESLHNFFEPILSNAPILFKNNTSHKLQIKLNHSNLICKSPILLAAGLDKKATMIQFFDHLGLGGIEVGTITKNPQIGNPKPRIIKDFKNKSIINWMGFPSIGEDKSKINLLNQKINLSENYLVGVNIGKNLDTPIENAHQDYAHLIDSFNLYADYLVINISSPNTKNLRNLLSRDYFFDFLSKLKIHIEKSRSPIFIKISPDLTIEEIINLITVSMQFNIKGFIVSNTTINHSFPKGGLSGPSLFNNVYELINKIFNEYNSQKKLPFDLIAAGGISNIDQLIKLWKLDVKAIQIFSAFIFQGPTLIKKLNSDIIKILEKTKSNSLDELIENKDLLKELT